MTEKDQNQNIPPDIEGCLEALLFVADGSVTINFLAEVLEKNVQEIENGLQLLDNSLKARGSLALQKHAGRVQLTTSPSMAPLVEKFLGLEATSRLSRAALETMAIIGYRQPITRPGIDAIRGVNSDGVLKTLLARGLVQEAGRSEGPGRPILFEVTTQFLQHFGLSSIDELPPLETEGIAATETIEQPKLLKD